MNLSERGGVRITDLGLPKLNHLLESGKLSMGVYDIPTQSALWYGDMSTLALKMETSLMHQGHEGICNGAFIDSVLHLVTGLASSIRSEADYEKISLAAQFCIWYKRPLPIDIPIQVTATVRPKGNEHFLVFGRITPASGENKIFDRAVMYLATDTQVRKP